MARKDAYVVILRRWDNEADSYRMTPYAYSPTMREAKDISESATGLEDGDLLIPMDMAKVSDIEKYSKTLYVWKDGRSHLMENTSKIRNSTNHPIMRKLFEADTWMGVWEREQDADNMVDLAILYDVDRRLMVLMACECVEQLGYKSLNGYLNVAYRWCEGRATIAEVSENRDRLSVLATVEGLYRPAMYALWTIVGEYHKAAMGATMFTSESLVKIGRFDSIPTASKFLSNIVRKHIPLHVLLMAKIDMDSKDEQR